MTTASTPSLRNRLENLYVQRSGGGSGGLRERLAARLAQTPRVLGPDEQNPAVVYQQQSPPGAVPGVRPALAAYRAMENAQAAADAEIVEVDFGTGLRRMTRGELNAYLAATTPQPLAGPTEDRSMIGVAADRAMGIVPSLLRTGARAQQGIAHLAGKVPGLEGVAGEVERLSRESGNRLGAAAMDTALKPLPEGAGPLTRAGYHVAEVAGGLLPYVAAAPVGMPAVVAAGAAGAVVSGGEAFDLIDQELARRGIEGTGRAALAAPIVGIVDGILNAIPAHRVTALVNKYGASGVRAFIQRRVADAAIGGGTGAVSDAAMQGAERATGASDAYDPLRTLIAAGSAAGAMTGLGAVPDAAAGVARGQQRRGQLAQRRDQRAFELAARQITEEMLTTPNAADLGRGAPVREQPITVDEPPIVVEGQTAPVPTGSMRPGVRHSDPVADRIRRERLENLYQQRRQQAQAGSDEGERIAALQRQYQEARARRAENRTPATPPELGSSRLNIPRTIPDEMGLGLATKAGYTFDEFGTGAVARQDAADIAAEMTRINPARRYALVKTDDGYLVGSAPAEQIAARTQPPAAPAPDYAAMERPALESEAARLGVVFNERTRTADLRKAVERARSVPPRPVASAARSPGEVVPQGAETPPRTTPASSLVPALPVADRQARIAEPAPTRTPPPPPVAKSIPEPVPSPQSTTRQQGEPQTGQRYVFGDQAVTVESVDDFKGSRYVQVVYDQSGGRAQVLLSEFQLAAKPATDAAITPQAAPTRQPWEMTNREYAASELAKPGAAKRWGGEHGLSVLRGAVSGELKGTLSTHRSIVQDAIREGKIDSHPDYPDLQRQAEARTPPPGEAVPAPAAGGSERTAWTPSPLTPEQRLKYTRAKAKKLGIRFDRKTSLDDLEFAIKAKGGTLPGEKPPTDPSPRPTAPKPAAQEVPVATETAPKPKAKRPATRPKQVRSTRPFSRADLEARIIKQYERFGIDLHDESVFDQLNQGASGATVFYKRLPAEVREYIQGKPHMRAWFTVTDDVAKAGGDDAMRELGGDLYFETIDRRATGKLRRARETLAKTGDPQDAFLLALHDNLPHGHSEPKQAMKPDDLPAGSRFEINGEKFEVLTDPTGNYRVLKDGEDFPVVPLDALDEVPVDQGTLIKGKARRMQPDGGARIDKPASPNAGQVRNVMGREAVVLREHAADDMVAELYEATDGSGWIVRAARTDDDPAARAVPGYDPVLHLKTYPDQAAAEKVFDDIARGITPEPAAPAEPAEPGKSVSSAGWSLANNDDVGIFGQKSAVDAGEQFGMFNASRSADRQQGQPKPKEIDAKGREIIDREARPGRVGWKVGDKVKIDTKIPGVRRGTYEVVTVAKASMRELDDVDGREVSIRRPTEDLGLASSSGKAFELSSDTLAMYGVNPPDPSTRIRPEVEEFSKLTWDEKQAKYDGIERGESLEDWERRMGFYDTPGMFGDDAPPAPPAAPPDQPPGPDQPPRRRSPFEDPDDLFGGGAGAFSIRPQFAQAPITQTPTTSTVRWIAQDGKAMGAIAQRGAVKGIPMPELVRLARSLLGAFPNVRKLRKAGALGVFRHSMFHREITIAPHAAKDPAALAEVLAHEIGHLIDYLPDSNLSRGNLNARLRSMSPIFANLGDLSRQMAALERSIKALGEAPNKEIKAELVALTEWWSPYDKTKVPDKYVKYRESARELYAEAMSVLLNSPGELQRRAPKFYQAWMRFIDRKPVVKTAYLNIQDMLHGTPEELAKLRRADIVEGFARGEDVARMREKELRARMVSVLEDLAQAIWDKAHPLVVRERAALKAGAALNDARAARYALEELSLRENVNHLMMKRAEKEISQVIQKAGVTTDQLGEYLVLRRIMGDRAEIANPYGHTPNTAAEQLANLEKSLGPKRLAAVDQALTAFDRIVFDAAERATDAGVYNRKTFDTVIVPNTGSYAAFRVVDYIDGDYVPHSIRQQAGTFKEVANPLTATLAKTIALNRVTEANIAKNELLAYLRKHFPDDIKGAKRLEPGRDPGKTSHPDHDWLIVLGNGVPYAYEVPRQLAAMFQSHDIGVLRRVAGFLSRSAYQVFHPLFVTYNPGFGVMNVVRDVKRTYKNSPAGKVTARQLLEGYRKAARPAWNRARRVDDPLIDQMLADRALDRPFTWTGDVTDDSTAYQRLLEQAGLGSSPGATRRKIVDWVDAVLDPAAAKLRGLGWARTANALSGEKIVSAIGAPFRGVETVNAFLETLPKVAAYEAVAQNGTTGRARSYIVRNLVGTPNTRRRGLATDMGNGLAMYLNVAIQGWRSDAEVAFRKDTRGAYWTRVAAVDLLPKVAMKAAELGLFGAGVAALFNLIPEDEKAKYIIIPVGFHRDDKTGEAKAAYVRVPHDDTTRPLAAMAWMLLAGQPREAVEQMLGTMPSSNPALSIAGKWMAWAGGHNPQDDFRGGNIINRDQWEAGALEQAKALGAWTVNQAGIVSETVRPFTRDAKDPAAKTGLERVVQHVPGLSRVVRFSNRGVTEREYEAIREKEATDARRRLAMPQKARGLMREYNHLVQLKSTGRDALNDVQRQRLARLGRFSAWYNERAAQIRKADERGDKALADKLRDAIERQAEKY